ncbi:hypothetical protein [Methylobacterium sp. SyP6R]|uniref:hypothetical protein n=1 Tax=Methylobacterium sp. SyP6R TaxID=2718876 RepID=UPI001F18F97F|nr:hypothetical protein [Methylobacterium sp. SyP6R]MCF4123815.1 hypothetical protein [Methylobacterium sp. SyP6R]
MSAAAAFDSDRFRKCMALAIGGATEGERKAGRAAAARVAVAAGLSFEEAERRAGRGFDPGGFEDALSEAVSRGAAEAVAEAMRKAREAAAHQEALRDEERREAARERRRQAKAAKQAWAAAEHEMAEWPERAKAEQAERDRLWAEQRAARQAAETIGAST